MRSSHERERPGRRGGGIICGRWGLLLGWLMPRFVSAGYEIWELVCLCEGGFTGQIPPSPHMLLIPLPCAIPWTPSPPPGCPNLQSFVHFSTAFASGLRTGLIREEPAEFGRWGIGAGGGGGLVKCLYACEWPQIFVDSARCSMRMCAWQV